MHFDFLNPKKHICWEIALETCSFCQFSEALTGFQEGLARVSRIYNFCQQCVYPKVCLLWTHFHSFLPILCSASPIWQAVSSDWRQVEWWAFWFGGGGGSGGGGGGGGGGLLQEKSAREKRTAKRGLRDLSWVKEGVWEQQTTFRTSVCWPAPAMWGERAGEDGMGGEGIHFCTKAKKGKLELVSKGQSFAIWRMFLKVQVRVAKLLLLTSSFDLSHSRDNNLSKPCVILINVWEAYTNHKVLIGLSKL